MLLAQGHRKLQLLWRMVVSSVESLHQGPAILAHASQLEAQLQNILSSTCYPHMDAHRHVLSQEGFSSCPQHDICAISHSCVDSGPWGFWTHATVMTKKSLGPSVRKLGGRKEDVCWLLCSLRLVRCKSEPVLFRLLTTIQHFLSFHFLLEDTGNGTDQLVLFMLWLEDSRYERCRWILSKVRSATKVCEILFLGCSMQCK